VKIHGKDILFLGSMVAKVFRAENAPIILTAKAVSFQFDD
jgi:hypothetical protein